MIGIITKEVKRKMIKEVNGKMVKIKNINYIDDQAVIEFEEVISYEKEKCTKEKESS